MLFTYDANVDELISGMFINDALNFSALNLGFILFIAFSNLDWLNDMQSDILKALNLTLISGKLLLKLLLVKALN